MIFIDESYFETRNNNYKCWNNDKTNALIEDHPTVDRTMLIASITSQRILYFQTTKSRINGEYISKFHNHIEDEVKQDEYLCHMYKGRKIYLYLDNSSSRRAKMSEELKELLSST